jgi:hypothetical protein
MAADRLTADYQSLQVAPQPFSAFGRLLIFALGGYLFFNRAFAWIHIPGIPLFLGEVVLAVGLVEALQIHPFGLPEWVVRRSAALKVLLLFMALGAARLLLDLSDFGILAVRDSAIWYYGLYAILVASALYVDESLFPRMLGWYRRAIPWFLVWAPLAVIIGRLFSGQAPAVPDSNTSVVAFKSGDIAVHAALAVAFLWLFERPVTAGERRRQYLLGTLGLVGILVAGTQNRGGLVSAAVILGVSLLLSAAKERMLFSWLATLLLLAAVAVVFDIRVDLGRRELSVEQISQNVESIMDPEAATSGNLAGTVQWRLEAWALVIDDALLGPYAVTGRGFGPNLAFVYGLGGDPEATEGLRNPHNSHLNVLARMGAVGFGLWLLVWGVWLAAVGRRVTDRDGRRNPLAAWLLAGVLGMLVNAIFDPTLEGPQVAVWLWTLVGLGASSRVTALREREAAELSAGRPA